MPAYLGNWGRFVSRFGSFTPNGKPQFIGDERAIRVNPAAEDYGAGLSARLFVGFNVGELEGVYQIKDLIPIVEEVRTRQTGRPDASFAAQTGIYKHDAPKIGAVIENGAQVIIIDTEETPIARWKDHLLELAESLAERLQQESVLVELSEGGIVRRVWKVTPPRRRDDPSDEDGGGV